MKREYDVLGGRLEIHFGDITALEVDGIVNSENSDLLMDAVGGPSVSAAIRRVEGEEAARELARLGPVEPGRAVVLPARRLPCKWVLHAAAVVKTEGGHRSSVEVVRTAVRSAVTLAAGLGLRSLAFPAFGVRAGEVPQALASEVMIEELIRALGEPTPLRRVVVALLDAESFLAFFEEGLRRATEANEPARVRVEGRGEEVVWTLGVEGPIGARVARVWDGRVREGLREALGGLRGGSRRGRGEAAVALRGLGGWVRRLVPEAVWEAAGGEGVRPLFLTLDEEVADVPWELAWDGERFLGERAQVARVLLTDAEGVGGGGWRGGGVLSALVLGGGGELVWGSAESEAVFELLWRRGGERVRCRLLAGRRAGVGRVLEALEGADVVHWCGHTEGGEGWCVGGGVVGAEELASVRWRARLVLSNSCGGGVEFARACLLGGAQNYVGAQWEVGDEEGRRFALALYEGLVLGRTLGEALGGAREAMAGDPVHWAAYQHYGDPRQRLFEPVGALGGGVGEGTW